MFDLTTMFSESWFFALGQVLMIDVVLAGDNAIVIGLAAARILADRRKKVILLGLIAAVVLRILLSMVAVKLLAIIGLLLAGGVLRVGVGWRSRRAPSHDKAHIIPEVETGASVNKAIMQILIADVSMSLDNVLAVAGAARHHMDVLVVGLLLSIALMGAAASFIARLLEKYRWISYIGLLIVLYVALEMIYRGAIEVWGALN